MFWGQGINTEIFLCLTGRCCSSPTSLDSFLGLMESSSLSHVTCVVQTELHVFSTTAKLFHGNIWKDFPFWLQPWAELELILIEKLRQWNSHLPVENDLSEGKRKVHLRCNYFFSAVKDWEGREKKNWKLISGSLSIQFPATGINKLQS